MRVAKAGRIAALVGLAASLACSKAIVVPVTANSTRVLFVGNSLTYFNDLPETVAAIAASAGDDFRVEMAAASNVAIIDHLHGATNAVQRLQSQKWDFVVLQQGPTTTALCRDSMVMWTKLFDPHIRAAGATPALFMTWPQGADWSRMPLVVQSNQESARAVNGIFIPAGEAWRLLHETDPQIAVYGPDKFHPSELGSFLAALTIYERLSGRDVRGIPPKAFVGRRELALPDATVRKLHDAAHQANLLHHTTGQAPATKAHGPGSSLVSAQGC